MVHLEAGMYEVKCACMVDLLIARTYLLLLVCVCVCVCVKSYFRNSFVLGTVRKTFILLLSLISACRVHSASLFSGYILQT